MKIQIIIGLLLLFSCSVMGQEPEESSDYYEEEEIVEEEIDYTPMFSFGLEFNVGIPVGGFRQNLNRLSFGGGGYFLVRTNPSSSVPVLAGLSGGISIYDSQSQDQVILIDGFSVDARLTTRNSIFMGHGMLRILPPVDLPFQPFIDGMFGVKNLYTRTTLEERIAFEANETLETYIEQGDWAISYGGAVGVQFLVGGDEGVYFLIEARCSYLGGDAADYLVRIEDPNVQIVDTIDAFEEKNSATDMIIPQIGISFVF